MVLPAIGAAAQQGNHNHTCSASRGGASNQCSAVQCGADLKVVGGRLLASCEGGSKLGSVELSWNQRSAYISQKVVSVNALSKTCSAPPHDVKKLLTICAAKSSQD